MQAAILVLNKKSFSIKTLQYLGKVKKKKRFGNNAYLWTPDQKQFLAAILNSGAILFFGA
jgi:hypothetical protein